MPTTFQLEDGPAVQRELVPGATHEYTIAVHAGEYLVVAAEQRGVDVRLELTAPGTAGVVAIDSPGGAEGFERVSLVADADGEWHLAVLADPGIQDPGAQYTIAIETRRPATDRDRRSVAGEYALAAGEEFRRGNPNPDLVAAQLRYTEALVIAREIGDRSIEAKAMHRIGWVHSLQGEVAASIDAWREACDVSSEIGDLVGEATASGDLGSILLTEWKLAEAEQAYRRSLARWQEFGRADGIADAWHGLGSVLDIEGRNEEARSAFEQALAINPRMSASFRAGRGATFRFSLGQVLSARGEYPEARDLIAEALTFWESSGEVELQCFALTKLGEISTMEGDLESAKDRFGRALALAESVHQDLGIALAENALGDALTRSGELGPARTRLESAKERFAGLGDRYNEAIAVMNLGRYWFAVGDDAKAAELYTEALAQFESLSDRQGVASNRYALARSSFRSGDLASARRNLDLALAEIESLRGEALRIASRSTYFASRQDYFDLDLAILIAERDPVQEAEWNARAFAASERRRARSLLDLLGDSVDQVRSDADPEKLVEERLVQNEINGLEKERRVLVESGTPSARLERIESQQRSAITRLEGIRGELRSVSPRRAALAKPKPIGLDRACALLDGQTALLAYSLGAQQSVLWVLQRSGVKGFYLLPPRAEIESLARDAAELFARVDAGSKVPRQATTIALARAILPMSLAALHVERLAVVAEGALQLVPFAALPDLEQPTEVGGQIPPLLERFQLIQLPSVSALSVLREESRRRLPILGGIIVVSDPVYSPNDPRVVRTHSNSLQGLNSFPETYRRLPATEREAEAILSTFPKGQRFIERGFNANRDLILRGGLQRHRFVHVAAHAEIDSDRPNLSGLVLSTVDSQGLPREGHVRLHEIYNLDIPAELVVLSACSTGIGRNLRGEGLESLARGFLSAGAPRLVVSLWPVEDEGTAVLMELFYRAMLQERQGPAGALRKAQIALRQDLRFRDPYHWAGFSFLGDWQFPGVPVEEVDKKEDLPIEQIHTGGTTVHPKAANPLPGPRPKKRPHVPGPPPPSVDEEGFPHGGKAGGQ